MNPDKKQKIYFKELGFLLLCLIFLGITYLFPAFDSENTLLPNLSALLALILAVIALIRGILNLIKRRLIILNIIIIFAAVTLIFISSILFMFLFSFKEIAN